MAVFQLELKSVHRDLNQPPGDKPLLHEWDISRIKPQLALEGRSSIRQIRKHSIFQELHEYTAARTKELLVSRMCLLRQNWRVPSNFSCPALTQGSVGSDAGFPVLTVPLRVGLFLVGDGVPKEQHTLHVQLWLVSTASSARRRLLGDEKL